MPVCCEFKLLQSRIPQPPNTLPEQRGRAFRQNPGAVSQIVAPQQFGCFTKSLRRGGDGSTIDAGVGGRATCIGHRCRPRKGRFFEDCPQGVRSLAGRLRGDWPQPLRPRPGSTGPRVAWDGEGSRVRRAERRAPNSTDPKAATTAPQLPPDQQPPVSGSPEAGGLFFRPLSSSSPAGAVRHLPVQSLFLHKRFVTCRKPGPAGPLRR